MFCTKCGQEIQDGINFCTNCGEPVKKETEKPPSAFFTTAKGFVNNAAQKTAEAAKVVGNKTKDAAIVVGEKTKKIAVSVGEKTKEVA